MNPMTKPTWCLSCPALKVCLDFVGRNLAAVMKTEGYSHMVAACPGLQSEILSTVAALGGTPDAASRAHGHVRGGGGAALAAIGGVVLASGGGGCGRGRELQMDVEDIRRVRSRRDT